MNFRKYFFEIILTSYFRKSNLSKISHYTVIEHGRVLHGSYLVLLLKQNFKWVSMHAHIVIDPILYVAMDTQRLDPVPKITIFNTYCTKVKQTSEYQDPGLSDHQALNLVSNL